MDPQSIGLLATAISAPITAAILKLVPQRGVRYDGPPTESLVVKEACVALRSTLDARLLRLENAIIAIENRLFPTTKKEAHP